MSGRKGQFAAGSFAAATDNEGYRLSRSLTRCAARPSCQGDNRESFAHAQLPGQQAPVQVSSVTRFSPRDDAGITCVLVKSYLNKFGEDGGIESELQLWIHVRMVAGGCWMVLWRSA